MVIKFITRILILNILRLFHKLMTMIMFNGYRQSEIINIFIHIDDIITSRDWSEIWKV